jgi:GTP diphosphokinase / guanosine-3',5'-bis(diphosphate) 3'-diphosphatase
MVRIEDICDKVSSYNPDADLDIIERAYIYSAKVHRGQTRLSGEAYISHPLEVAGILAKMKMDSVTVSAGILHDTVEDGYTTLEEIKILFTDEMVDLVDGVTKMGKMEFLSRQEKQAENFRKMLLAMAKDIRVILIKLADRLHNMRTLEFVPPEKQLVIASETMDIYAPIANRLGIGWIKGELEDTSFRYLNPENHAEIKENIENTVQEREEYINKVKETIEKDLNDNDIHHSIEGRTKSIFSIYRKMQTQMISFHQVYDLMALRIITDSIRSCYTILGVIHSLWKPVPGRFKDYIAMPKDNMYQSLHTTVIATQGQRVEFQIRTEDMHKTAEQGIAAHWRYKEGKDKEGKYDEKFHWLRQLLEWQQDLKDPKEFMDTVKIDLFPEEVYVFTPKGEVKSFPRGATPLDFAYDVHTDLGDQCVGAKVNGKIVPLKYQLADGDIVDILTSPNHVPNRDWLRIVKTPRAKSKIKAWIKKEQKERSIVLGREILEKELKKYGVNPVKILKSGELKAFAEKMNFQKIEDLLEAIGFGKTSVNQVITKVIPEEVIEEHKKAEKTASDKTAEPTGESKAEGAIKVDGLDDILIRYAKCCNPIPGDEIIGYITRGRGVTVHTVDCPVVSEIDYGLERKIEVDWDIQKKIPHTVTLAIHTDDKPGVLSNVSSAISECDVNITQANISTTEDKKASLVFTIEIFDLEQLQGVIKNISQIKWVQSVQRVRDPYPSRKRAKG